MYPRKRKRTEAINVEIHYENYDYVLLDASSLKYDIPEELWEYQKDHTLLAAKTFKSECNGYELLLPDGKLALFQENKRRIAGSLCTQSPFRESLYVRNGFNRDALGLLRLLCGRSTRSALQERNCLLVTGDLSQLESIRNYSVPADVLFLQNGAFYNHQNTEELEKLFDYEKVPEVNAGVFSHDKKGAVAYTTDRMKVKLTYVCKRKKSSWIYQTPDSRYAKIFDKIRLTQNKTRHVEQLAAYGKELGLNWVLFPTELLYADQDCRVPVGYLMTKAGNTKNITQSLHLKINSTSEKRWEVYKTEPYYDYLYLALMITRQVAYLKSYNIWPSDYNLTNFALFWPQLPERSAKPSDYTKLYMWDTDSFCWKGYVSKRWCADLEPVSSHQGFVGEMCADALYQQVFSILTLGECPYGLNREKPPRVKIRERFFYIPEKLRRLFHDVFVCGYPPSVPCLLQALEEVCGEMHYVWDEERGIWSQITLEQVNQRAQQMAEEGADFRPSPKRTKLVLPQYPKAPGVSATLHAWTRPTAPFSAKRVRRREQEKTESGMGNGAG